MKEMNFIQLKRASEHTNILINIDSIVSICDLRSDKAAQGAKDWSWNYTNIECTNGHCYAVKETEKEILESICALKVNANIAV